MVVRATARATHRCVFRIVAARLVILLVILVFATAGVADIIAVVIAFAIGRGIRLRIAINYLNNVISVYAEGVLLRGRRPSCRCPTSILMLQPVLVNLLLDLCIDSSLFFEQSLELL